MADLSIVIAHKHTRANDKALAICLQTLIDNTVSDYELLIDTTTPEDPYRVYNRLAGQARGKWLVFLNSDTFAGPGWDAPMLAAADDNLIVVPVLVECGQIGVNVMNCDHNFGITPDTFKRKEFEGWVKSGGEWRDGTGWYMPSLHPRVRFLDLGGFAADRGAFGIDQVDTWYWETWEAAGGKVLRVKSYFYHLQNWSNEKEQAKRGG